MLDKLVLVSLVLCGSGLFRFIAPQIGVSISLVTMLLFALNGLYLVAKANHTLHLLQQRGMGRWICLFLFWPFATLVYAPEFDTREIGLQLYLFSLFLTTVIFVRLNGLPSMFWVLTLSLVITLIGMPLSVMAPQYFEEAAALADARSEQLGRPIGFFLQPNRLAFCLCWLFIAWYALWPRKTVVREVLAVLAFLGLELVTGSRGGVLVGTGIVAILLAFNWKIRLLRGRLLVTGVLMLLCLAGGILGLRTYLEYLSDTGYRRHGDLVDRMENMVHFQFSPEGSVSDDVSLEHRVSSQAAYLDLILDEPVLGHGFGANSYFLETGRLWLSAHSEALTRAFEYGIFYPLAWLAAIGSLYFRRGRKRVESALGTNAISQFAGAFAVIFTYASIMEEGRVFSMVLGLFFVLVHCPEHMFHRDEETGTYGAALTRKEIRARRAAERAAVEEPPSLPAETAEAGEAP